MVMELRIPPSFLRSNDMPALDVDVFKRPIPNHDTRNFGRLKNNLQRDHMV